MPKFRYVGDDARTFPHASLEVSPGITVDAPTNPDPRYFTKVTGNAVNTPAETDEEQPA